jgi:hypothetical protein
MIQVNIKDRITKEITNSGKFETLQLSTEWVVKHEGKSHPWGKYLPAREIPATEAYNSLLKDYEYEKEVIAAYIDYEYQKDEEGNLVLVNGEPVILSQTQIPAVTETWIMLLPEYEIETLDITAEYEAQQAKLAMIKLGAEYDRRCIEALNYIGGFNLLNNRTIEQIDQLEVQFASAKDALKSGRPDKAYSLIASIEPDGIIVTTDLKTQVINILAGN